MFCQRCGSPIAAGARFCPKCGLPVNEALGAPSMKRPGIITLLAVLDFFFVVIYAGVAIALLAFTEGEEEQVAVVVGIILAIAAVFLLFAGIGMLRLRPWGRIIQIVFACVGLLAFPMGTIISGLILYYLFQPGVRVLFSGKEPSALTLDEIGSLHRLQISGGAIAIIVIIGGLAFVAIMGILAAIAIPNLLTAIQRAKQKRTVADMYTLVRAIDEHTQRTQRFPIAESIQELIRVTGSPVALEKDGWGNPFRFLIDGTTYWLMSGGRDGAFQYENPADYPNRATTNFDCDIVVASSELVQYPDGIGAGGE